MEEWEMNTYQVQLWIKGKPKPYEHVWAESAKAAAEKLYGHSLGVVGSNDEMRACVRPPAGFGGVQMFYDTKR